MNLARHSRDDATSPQGEPVSPQPAVNPAADALELLSADHAAVRELFARFAQLAGQRAPAARRKALAEQICLSLTIHAKLEEELLYPLARTLLPDHDALDDAQAEHASARDLVCRLVAMPADDPLFDARVAVLGEYVAHHVTREQSQLFPRLARAGVDLALLGQRLRERKAELEAVTDALREEALVSAMA